MMTPGTSNTQNRRLSKLPLAKAAASEAKVKITRQISAISAVDTRPFRRIIIVIAPTRSAVAENNAIAT
jgi:hypothetical protein